MAEVLTQEEIDALLKSISTSKPSQQQAAAKETVYLYDFKHPSRVSKDQLRSLRTIHESFSRMLGTYLTTLLRTMVDVQLLSIDQVTFLEFTMAMSNPGCIWVFTLQQYEGKGILEVSPELIVLTIERLFGGEGKHSNEVRALSVIEQNVAGKIIEKCLRIYDEAWIKALPIQTQVHSFEMNPQFAQVAPSSETAVVMFFEINVRNTTFPMNICFPYFVLDPLIQKLSSENWVGHSLLKKTDSDRERIEHSLRQTEVEMTVCLGETSLKPREILELEAGDVIVLETKVGNPLKVSVEDRIRFMVMPGILEKKKAMVIENVLVPLDEPKRTDAKGHSHS
jgi:flagellar motor switch protein FliM